ncbi:MAG: hypothetical protein QXU82_01890 [Candidatus Aenigmatarchaeota archaeon]
MAVDYEFKKELAKARYGSEMINSFKFYSKNYGSDEKAYMLEKLGGRIGGAFVPKPSPTMSPKAASSQFWNNLSDWFTYYWSPAKDIPMGLNEKKKGYEKFEKVISDITRMNQFLRHRYHYYADEVGEDEWRTPKDFFWTRWADRSGSWPWPEDIADDCEGTAWGAHHAIRVSNNVSSKSIIDRLNEGVRQNVIACCFNDSGGHAYNQHGSWSVGNWGRIDHGSDNPVVMGKDFIEDANDFSFYVENEDGTEAEYIEGGEAAFYETDRRSVKQYLDVVSRPKYAVLTGEIVKELIGKIDRSNMELKDKAIEKYGLPTKGVMRLVNREIRERTPLARRIADEIDIELRKIAPLKLARA